MGCHEGWRRLGARRPCCPPQFSPGAAQMFGTTREVWGFRTNKASEESVPETQHGHERFLRDLDAAEALHSALALGLLLQQLALPGNVAAVALRQDVLAHRPDRLAGDDLAAD